MLGFWLAVGDRPAFARSGVSVCGGWFSGLLLDGDHRTRRRAYPKFRLEPALQKSVQPNRGLRRKVTLALAEVDRERDEQRRE
jgi:hypothetical protein